MVQWIAGNITEYALKINGIFNGAGSESSLKQVSDHFVFRVMPPYKKAQKALKCFADRDRFFFDKKVCMVGHEAPCVNINMFLVMMFKKQSQKFVIVFVGFEE